MVTLSTRIFIKNQEQQTASSLCHSYALLCGIVGIILNLLLFTSKVAIGFIAHSVAISADAFNNLGDAGSNLIAIFGFWIASFGAGREHPFGHGRMEWLIGLFTSLAVIFIGFEFTKSSILAIVKPPETRQSLLTILILTLSILVKLYMYLYNSRISKKIGSSSMKATAIDCLSDCASTGAVLVSALIKLFTDIETDGWCGLVVSFFIIFAGYCSIKEVMERIIGLAPNKAFLDKVNNIIKPYNLIRSVYDLTIHDYGFGRFVVSMRIAGDYDKRESLHSIADDISFVINTQLNCRCTVQTDYLYDNENEAKTVLENIEQLVSKTDCTICLQNFRLTKTENHIDLVLDLIMPSALQDMGEVLREKINHMYPQYRTICNIIILHNHPMPIRI